MGLVWFVAFTCMARILFSHASTRRPFTSKARAKCRSDSQHIDSQDFMLERRPLSYPRHGISYRFGTVQPGSLCRVPDGIFCAT